MLRTESSIRKVPGVECVSLCTVLAFMSEKVEEQPPAKRARLENHCNSHTLKENNQVKEIVCEFSCVYMYMCVCRHVGNFGGQRSPAACAMAAPT